MIPFWARIACASVAVGCALIAAPPAGAAIDVRGTPTSALASGVSSLSISKPAGVVSGDVLVATVSVYNTSAIGAPVGWSAVRDNVAGTMRQASFVKVAGSSEPTSYDFSITSGKVLGGITAYSGAHGAAPVDASAAATGFSPDAVAPSVTTSRDAARVVVAVSFAKGHIPVDFEPSTLERWEQSNGGASANTGGSADFAQVTAGVTGTRTANNGGFWIDWIAHTIALNPALPPAAPTIDSSPASTGSVSTPTWSFSGEAGASFECRLQREATVISDWAACTSPKTYDLTTQLDGVYTFSVRAVNDVGAGAATSSEYRLDRVAPAAPAIGSGPASPGNDPAPAWSFSGEAGASFECRLERGAATVSDWTVCTSPRTYDLSAQPDGAYSFSVRARDAAGNTGAAQAAAYELDRSAPAVPTIGSGPGAIGNDPGPSWSFSGEAGTTFECRLDRGSTVVSGWSACTSPRTYDLIAEADGLYGFWVRARDAAGNASSAASDVYALDRTAPAAPSIDSTPGVIGRDVNPSWSFSGEAEASFECRLQRGSTILSQWAACTSPESYDLSAEPDGTYTFSVRASDTAGNRGPAADHSYALDTGEPSDPTIDSAPGATGSGRNPAWSFSGAGAATYECRLDRGATTVSDWSACASPHSYDLTGKPDGTYIFSVRGLSEGGTPGSSTSDAYLLDTVAPQAPTIDASPPAIGNDATPTWTFSGEAESSFECRLERGSTTVADWTACASPYGYDLSGEPDGDYTFLIRAKDAAGNTGPARSGDYVLDRSVPPVPTIDTAPGRVASNTTPAWSFSGDPDASFQCRLERGTTTLSDWAACASPHGYDLSNEPDGDYTFSLRARNTAGTTSAAASNVYTLDTSAPAAPAVTSAQAAAGSSRSPSWSFSGEPGASFDCRLERGSTTVFSWASCSSPKVFDLAGEPDGSYVFSVRARDAAGNTGFASSSDYELDTVPGALDIVRTPGRLGRERNPAWAFAGETTASFECRLKRGASALSDWAPCSSPRVYDLSGEPDGTYSFSVRATDGGGNRSAERSHDYELDTTPPRPATIDRSVERSRDPTPTWSFSAHHPVTLECRLDVGNHVVLDWHPCQSPFKADLREVEDGAYRFAVRAVDEAGNHAEPAVSRYHLDTTPPGPPTPRSSPGPSGYDVTPTWAFTGEADATFECRLRGRGRDLSGWRACASPRRYDLAAEGPGGYRFSVRARDVAGNTGTASSDDYELLPHTDGAAPQPTGENDGGTAPQAPDADPVNAAPGSPPAGADDGAGKASAPGANGGRAHGTAGGAHGSTVNRHPPGARERPGAARDARGEEPGGIRSIGRKLERAAKVLVEHPDKTLFPMSLLFVVFGFLAVQSRIDRNDPKLALAPVFAEPDLAFSPPPTHERREGPAADAVDEDRDGAPAGAAVRNPSSTRGREHG